MITISRSLARRLRNALQRAGLGRSRGRQVSPPVQFLASSEGLLIRSTGTDFALDWHEPGPLPGECWAIPFEVLTAIEARSDTPVTLQRAGDQQIEVRWVDRGVPQSLLTDDLLATLDQPFLDTPRTFEPASEKLIPALRDAMQTTATEPGRFAFHMVQLRGTAGEIAATDGLQLLVQGGFRFPWQDDLLVCRTDFFKLPEFAAAVPVSIGKSETHLALRVGCWTAWLRCHSEGVRFPNTQMNFSSAEANSTRLQISSADAEFLVTTLPGLPARDEPHAPVTIDCNGQVAIRAQGVTQSQATELVLSQSTVAGPPIRLRHNRRFLARAIELGFREVLLPSRSQTILCRDEHRRYVWQALEGAPLLPGDCIRVDSSAATGVSRSRTAARHLRGSIRNRSLHSSAHPVPR